MSSLLAPRSLALVNAPARRAFALTFEQLASNRLVCVTILLVYCGWLFFYGIWQGELWRTETLRAIIGQEMLNSGNWIVPRLYGEPLFTKPPGMYIAIALFSWPFGYVSEFSARLPSAFAATITVLLFFWYVRRQLGAVAGLAAGLILPMSLMWIDKGNSAEIDMLQVMWVTGAVLFFLRATEGPSAERGTRSAELGSLLRAPRSEFRASWHWWLASLLFVAGGFLTKWTAPAFFYLTVASLLWWQGQLRLLWSRQHLVSAAIAAAICLGWMAAAIGSEGWDVFYPTLREEALHRLVPSYVPTRPYPWIEAIYHPLKLIITMLPWSLLALVTLRPGFMQLWPGESRRLLVAFHCWTWPNMLLWTLMSEHTPRHSFPLFPGISGLAVMAWLAWRQGIFIRRLDATRTLAFLLAVWIGVKATFLYAVVPNRNFGRQPRAAGQLIACHVPAGQVLYLFRLKDEGVLFYYGRPALRLSSPAELPSSSEPLYCILKLSEWQEWSGERRAELIAQLVDAQGDPIVLVRVAD